MATRADKKHTVADSGLNRFLEQLRNFKQSCDDVPDGWFSVRQMVESTGLSRPHVNRLVTAELGKTLEVGFFKTSTAFGIKRIPFYRVNETSRR